jgi:uncharacterized membrane protein
MAKKRNKPNINLPSQKITASGEPSPLERKIIAKLNSQHFSGPLPPPQVLIQYNKAVSDAADRIIGMAESQSNHRQDLESKVVEADIKSARTGLHYGLIIGLVAIAGGVACTLLGHELGGGIIGGTGITGLVGVFVYGSRQRRKERERRFNSVTKSA